VLLASVTFIPSIGKASGDGGFGRSLERISGVQLAENAVLLHMKPSLEAVMAAKTIVAEHDTNLPKTGVIQINGDYYQRRHWSWNQPIGSDFIRLWVSTDGFIVSNIGAKIVGESNLLLGISNGSQIVPLITESRGKVYISDSDPVLDFLSPYNANTWRYLLNPRSVNRIISYGIGIALFIAGILILLQKSYLILVLPVVAIIPFLITSATAFTTGDIKLIGVQCNWPHDNNSYGIVRALQKSGVDFIFGERGSTVLCVGATMHAKTEHHKLIILEPGASVMLRDGTTINSGVMPLEAVMNFSWKWRI